MHFVSFQGPSSLCNQVLGECVVPGGPCVLITYTVPLSLPGAQRAYHLRGAMCLLWGADLWLRTSWQMSTVQDPRKMWLANGSLLTVWWRMPVSGAETGAAACLLALAVAHLPLCLWQGEGPVCSWLPLLWYLLNSLFCEKARLPIRAFPGKVLFF